MASAYPGYQKNGLKVVDGITRIRLISRIIRPETAEEVDVVIAFTKSMKLGEKCLKRLKRLSTKIQKCFVLNGLGHEHNGGVPHVKTAVWGSDLDCRSIRTRVARLGGTVKKCKRRTQMVLRLLRISK